MRRFANVFQLVKIIGRQRRLPWDDTVDPPTSVRVTLPLGQAVRDLSPPGHERVTAWLKDRARWETVDLVDLLPWIAVVRRFSFDPYQGVPFPA